MDIGSGAEGDSTESLTSTLKAVLKINGSQGEEAHSQEEGEGSPTKPETADEEDVEEDNKDANTSDEQPGPSMFGASGGPQKIDLSQASDGECISIFGDDITIVTSSSSEMNSKSSGSNKVRIKPITKFDWTHKYYNGSLISVTNEYIAYAIKSRAFAVRVMSRKNSSDRLLLRGFMAPVCDVAFAHSKSSMIAAVDENGDFLIWQLSLNGTTTTAMKKLHVKTVLNDSLYHRLVWLTYMVCDLESASAEQLMQIQDDNGDNDPTTHRRLLAVTHGKNVEVWDVNAAFDIAENDEEDTGKDKLEAAYMTVSHDDTISDCVLSPEGSVIAVASHDGFVKFWQVSIEDTAEPTCLHKWQPHGSKPVSMVTFCDDRTQAQLVLYWRFMLTGCHQNSELKIWCTVSWNCLQTVSFAPAPGSTELSPALKCVLHAAADYLVISDINRKVVYVFRCLTDLKNGRASLSSISQYLLTTPILSFAISGAQKCKFKTLVAMDEEAEEASQWDTQESDGEQEIEEAEGGSDATKRVNGVLIRLVSINTKSLESLDIRFIPNASLAADESMISYSTYNTISDDLNIVSMDESMSIVSPSIENGQSIDELDDGQHEEEEDEHQEDESTNKTALTAIDAEQSTLIATNEDERQMEDKDEPPKTPERGSDPQMQFKDPLRTRVMDLVENIGAEQPPLAHSSPNIHRQYSDPEDTLGRGQGEGEATTTPDKTDDVQQPVLLTPDAFTASLRKPEDLISAETSFTHVTAFSGEHPSLYGSERDKSIQESTRPKSPIIPSSLTPPPGFPVMPSQAGAAFKEQDRQATPPLVSLENEMSPLDIAPQVSSYHSILPNISNEPGPFGDIQATAYMTKDQSPDLISSTSSIENLGPSSSDARILIGGPISGAVGGSGDALFMSSQAKVDGDNDSNASKRSDVLPTVPSAPWPKAPDVTMSRPIKKTTPQASREDFLRTSDLSQESQSSSLRLDTQLHADTTRPVQTIEPNLGVDILAAIASLQKQNEDMVKSLQKDITKKTNQISKSVDAALKKHEQQQNDKLDRALKSMSDSQRKFQTDSRAYSATAAEQSSGKLDRTIKHEMRNTVVPSLAKSLDPLKEQLLTTVSQKITATDSVLKENIGKMMRSKDTVDAIGNATGRAIHTAYREAFMQIIVPAMEKSCDVMFQQLSSTFQRGMNEAVGKLEKSLQSRVKGELERVGAAERQAREATAELKDTAANIQSKLSTTIEKDVPKLLKAEMKKAQETMTSEMSKALKRQQETSLKEQKAVLTECIHTAMAEIQPHQAHGHTKLPEDKSPHSMTPGRSPGPMRPTFEQQQQAILAQLHQGNINAAFQRALTASDLSLVMYVCEMVDPAVVFGASPCALHQPIILSLIQQLSCDLGRKTTVKLKYIQEAVMNLDHSHQVTKEHMHTVLDALVKNLDSHVAALIAQPIDASNTPIIKQMKMLSMAARSLLMQ